MSICGSRKRNIVWKIIVEMCIKQRSGSEVGEVGIVFVCYVKKSGFYFKIIGSY